MTNVINKLQEQFMKMLLKLISIKVSIFKSWQRWKIGTKSTFITICIVVGTAKWYEDLLQYAKLLLLESMGPFLSRSDARRRGAMLLQRSQLQPNGS